MCLINILLLVGDECVIGAAHPSHTPGITEMRDAGALSGCCFILRIRLLVQVIIKFLMELVAQDVKCASGLNKHFFATFASPKEAFTGGFARIGMKQMAASLNLYVPSQYRESNPFACSFAVGMCFAPILNIPR